MNLLDLDTLKKRASYAVAYCINRGRSTFWKGIPFHFFKANLLILLVYAFTTLHGEPFFDDSLVHGESNLSKDEWFFLIDYVEKRLEQDKDQIKVFANESGFVRVTLEDEKIPLKDKGIKKIRVNYWPPSTDPIQASVSIHDHTNYFESLILQGGYMHSLYDYAIGEEDSFLDVDVWKVSKLDESMEKVTTCQMKVLNQEVCQRGNLLLFPTSKKHRIETGLPTTLTLNVVFDHGDERDFFHIYPEKGTPYSEIRVNRPEIKEQREEILRQILEILKKV